MDISSELVSDFVKATNDTSGAITESTVYGVVKKQNDVVYVQLDGSELLTPVVSTVNAKDGDRVTVLIKNHTATITGNITSPSAGSDEIKDMTDVANKITELEGVVAKKVSTEDLDAESARIDALVADNVTIKAELKASEADIDKLQASYLTVEETLTANKASIESLEADIANIDAVSTKDLEAINAEIYNLQTTYATFETATTKNFEAVNADIDDLEANKASIDELLATNAKVTSLEADLGDINTLIFGSASGTSIHTSFANAVIAQLGDAQIKSAMIDSVSASKLTAGTIYTDDVTITSKSGNMVLSDNTMQISDSTRVRVQIGKDANNDYSINIWDENGNLMFSEGGITDSAIKDAIIRNDMVSANANISASKLDIDSLFTEINGSTNTIKSTKIYLDDKEQTLDAAFKSMTTTVDSIKSTQTSQGTAISAIQGQISSKIWQQDITTAVNNVELGNRNLIPSSRLIKNGVGPWSVTFTTVTNGQSDPFGNTNATVVKTTLANTYALITKNKVIKQLGKYSLSIWMKADKATTVNIVISADINTDNKTVCAVTTEWKRFTMTVDVTTLNRTYDLVIGGWSSFDTTATVHIAYPMLVYGSKPMDWSPAPEDTDGSISTLSTNYSTLNQTVSGIQTTVGSHTTSINGLTTRVTNAESSITQNANSISSKVSANGVISAINQTAETIKIQASKIDLVGAVTADCIASNAITAAKIATDALKSRNYVAGSTGSFLNLADGSFSAKNLSWTSDGKLKATDAELTGDIYCANGLWMPYHERDASGVEPGEYFEVIGIGCQSDSTVMNATTCKWNFGYVQVLNTLYTEEMVCYGDTKVSGALTIPNTIKGGNVPISPTDTISISALTDLKSYPSYIGSTYVGSLWYNVISSRHRNGSGDGTSYGLTLYTRLNAAGDLSWNKQYGASSWQASRTIVDSSNIGSYTCTYASNSNGKYYKFPDGTLICTKSVSFTLACTSAWGGVYESTSQMNFGSWAYTFSATPHISTSMTGTNDAYIGSVHNTSTTACGTAYAYRPVSTSSTSVKVDIIGIGRWK